MDCELENYSRRFVLGSSVSFGLACGSFVAVDRFSSPLDKVGANWGGLLFKNVVERQQQQTKKKKKCKSIRKKNNRQTDR